MKRIRTGRAELENVFTIGEVAEILRVHSATIYRLVNRGDLQGFKIGGAWRISRATLDVWLSPDHLHHVPPRA